uniref:lysozyme C, milk isozyme-like n=1 Tax=Pristiophorus japonicus TaxID=55135 RepID=UPI00398E8D7A
MKTLIVLSVLLSVASATVLSRCQVVKAIANSELAHDPRYTVADWVCMAKHESNYDTLAFREERGPDGHIWSADYGIFQINSRWWCDSWASTYSANACNVKCVDFLTNGDNLTRDIECAAIIVKQKGMDAWTSWVENCKGKWIGYYTYLCF